VRVRSNSDRKIGREAAAAKAKPGHVRERLRKRYRPNRVRILFVGESPPASGRFFYRADSGLYRAVRETLVEAFPTVSEGDFLVVFRALGCYLVDLCGEPVDRLTRRPRGRACRAGEAVLARTIRALRPKVIVTVVRSIRGNVARAQKQAGWAGRHVELPYPGRWHHHRMKFQRVLVPLLHRVLLGAKVPRRSLSASSTRFRVR
jgi:hypothetical protein